MFNACFPGHNTAQSLECDDLGQLPQVNIQGTQPCWQPVSDSSSTSWGPVTCLYHTHRETVFFIKIHLFIYYLFLAVWGLRCYALAFSSCGERVLLFVVVHGLLIVVVSLVVEPRL